MINVPINNKGSTLIGRLGENEHRVIVFRGARKIMEQYPEATVTVMHQRPDDEEAYPVSPSYVSVTDGIVYWTVQSGDLSTPGEGKCELVFTQGNTVAKTLIYTTRILSALDGNEDPPEPWESWIEDVAESADLARGYADGKHLDGTAYTSLNENNAKYWALQSAASAGHYPKIESGTWWVWDVQSGAFVDTHITAQGPAGQDGTDGTDGQDGQDGAPGVGVPSGGTTGQVMKKKSGTDYDTEWGNEPSIPVSDVQINGTSILNNGVANVPYADANNAGVAKVNSSFGLQMTNNGEVVAIQMAGSSEVKGGSNYYKPIVPASIHQSTFYGLAKAAGDTTQSQSSNTVGTYTETARSKIHDMLDAPVSVSGTTPSITALPGVRYVCGEVSTLDITLPASGDVEIIFDSGSTATVLTVTPPTGVTAVKWANGFDPTALDADTRYDLIITDGEWGLAASWAV